MLLPPLSCLEMVFDTLNVTVNSWWNPLKLFVIFWGIQCIWGGHRLKRLSQFAENKNTCIRSIENIFFFKLTLLTELDGFWTSNKLFVMYTFFTSFTLIFGFFPVIKSESFWRLMNLIRKIAKRMIKFALTKFCVNNCRSFSIKLEIMTGACPRIEATSPCNILIWIRWLFGTFSAEIEIEYILRLIRIFFYKFQSFVYPLYWAISTCLLKMMRKVDANNLEDTKKKTKNCVRMFLSVKPL